MRKVERVNAAGQHEHHELEEVAVVVVADAVVDPGFDAGSRVKVHVGSRVAQRRRA